jgi:hypothetical protein
MSELRLYKETYDLMLWIMNKTNGFPKSKRFSLGVRLENVSLDLVTACYRYPYATQKGRMAGSISRYFDELKLLLHVAHDVRLLGQSGYSYVLTATEKIGPMIGALLK